MIYAGVREFSRFNNKLGHKTLRHERTDGSPLVKYYYWIAQIFYIRFGIIIILELTFVFDGVFVSQLLYERFYDSNKNAVLLLIAEKLQSDNYSTTQHTS